MINTENKTQYPELRDLDFHAEKTSLFWLRPRDLNDPFERDNPESAPYQIVSPDIGYAVVRDKCIRAYVPTIYKTPPLSLDYEVLGLVGSRYQIVHNSDLYESLITASERTIYGQDTGVQLVEQSARNGAWSKATLHYPSIGRDIRQLTGKKTHLRLSASFTNTYDGSGKVRVQVGCTDLWCMNGCSILESLRLTGKHTSGFDLKSLTNFLVQGFETFNEKVSIWQQWADRRVTPVQAKKLLEDLGLEGRRAKGIMEQIEKEFSQRGESLWAIYSALTYEASHSSEQFPTRRTKGADTTALTLDRRAQNVERLVNNPAFLALAA